MTRSSLASLALFCLCAVAAGCSDLDDANEPRARRALPVVGGEPAEADDYPSTVALTDPWGSPFCTGTLVGPDTVVTAAHCLEEYWSGQTISTNDVRIIYGYTNPENAPSSERRTVASVVPHPDYSDWVPVDADGMGQSNDIGVVLLDEPIDNGVVTPILPPDQIDATLVSGTEVHVVGYGVYKLHPEIGGLLYKALTPYMRRIQWEMLAGSPGNPDSCNGDSGGPAYVVAGGNLYLAGITSRAWAQSQQSCGDGGIYTLASEYLDWIQSVGGELDGGVMDGGWDATGDVALLDADPACLPLTGACHPVTNEGCDTSQGEVCQLSGTGKLSCHEAPNDAQPGALCDQTDRFCVQGYHCAASLRCERLCCSDADCPSGGPCTPISTAVGTLGTCGLEPDAGEDGGEDGSAGAGGMAGAGGAGGAGGMDDAGTDAHRSEPASEPQVDVGGGCGCRTAGTSRPGAGATWILAFGAVWAARRRRSKHFSG